MRLELVDPALLVERRQPSLQVRRACRQRRCLLGHREQGHPEKAERAREVDRHQVDPDLEHVVYHPDVTHRVFEPRSGGRGRLQARGLEHPLRLRRHAFVELAQVVDVADCPKVLPPRLLGHRARWAVDCPRMIQVLEAVAHSAGENQRDTVSHVFEGREPEPVLLRLRRRVPLRPPRVPRVLCQQIIVPVRGKVADCVYQAAVRAALHAFSDLFRAERHPPVPVEHLP